MKLKLFQKMNTKNTGITITDAVIEYYNAHGCRLFFYAKELYMHTEDPLGRIYVAAQNAPMETFLWDLKE